LITQIIRLLVTGFIYQPLLSDGIPLEETDSPEGTATVYTRQYHLKYKSSNHILKWMVSMLDPT